MTRTRTAGSVRASPKTEEKRRSFGRLQAFLRAGRLSVTVATPSSSTSYSTRSLSHIATLSLDSEPLQQLFQVHRRPAEQQLRRLRAPEVQMRRMLPGEPDAA